MPRKILPPRLKQVDDGTWYIDFHLGGRSRTRSTGTKDIGVAQEVFAAFLTQIQRGEAEQRKPLTVKAAFGNIAEGAPFEPGYWHEHVMRRVVGVDTQRRASTHILMFFGDMVIANIRPEDVERYIKLRRAGRPGGGIGKGANASTVRRELSCLSAAINHAVRAKRLSPGDVPLIGRPPESPPRDRWLTVPECQRLLEAARSFDTAKKLSRIHRFIAIALATASRKTAILELKWSQVDLERGIIQFNPTGRSQTKKRRPPVPISFDLLPLLHVAKHEATTPYVLDAPHPIRWELELATRKAKLKDVTAHTFRHTWATLSAQAGVPLSDIAHVLGDSIRTVEKNYLHHCPDHLRGAINAVRIAA